MKSCLRLVIFAAILFQHSLVLADVTSECTDFWKTIWHTADQFEAHHDSKAGEKLLSLLPSDKIHSPANCEKRTETIEKLYRDHAFRDKLLAEGKILGYQLAFRMMPLSDGSFAEELNATVAGTIVKHPMQFLKSLKSEKGDVYCPKELILAEKEGDISDAVRNADFKKRAAALATVTDPDLAGLKTDCLKQLTPKKP